MRSVFVHFEKSKMKIVRDWLNEHMKFVGLDCGISDYFDEWEPDDLSEFRTKFPQPSAYVQIDISGQTPGDREVWEAVIGLLGAVPGSVAQDDYTDHLWTRREIVEGILVHGHPFFDYRGWHFERERQTPS